MDDELRRVLRAVLDEPVVVRVRHELGEPQARLLERLGASYVVAADAPVCVRFCGREECKVSAVTDAVVVRGWCRMYGCGEEPVEGSEFCSGHQHAAGEPVGLEEVAAVGKRADSGSAPLLVGEPERAAVSSSPEPGPAQPVPSPEGDPHRTGGGASYRTPVRWTREKVIAAIQEVAAKVGHTPSRKEMAAHGYASVPQKAVSDRLGTTWAALVREAGFEPLTRADGPGRNGSAAAKDEAPHEGSEREPEATDPAEAKVAPSRRALLAAEGAASRSDVLLRALALAARVFADTILEETA